LATHECQSCVNICGLGGIGKRGIQITAKSLSDESIAENRAAFLDLIETVIAKMNGDIQKYFRVCGTSALSDKAKEHIRERWSRHVKASGATNANAPDKKAMSAKRTPRSQVASTSSSPPRNRRVDTKPDDRFTPKYAEDKNNNDTFENQTYKSGHHNTPINSAYQSTNENEPIRSDQGFMPSHDSSPWQVDQERTHNLQVTPGSQLNSRDEQNNTYSNRSTQKIDSNEVPKINGIEGGPSRYAASPSEAAAALRARLQQIREKHQSATPSNRTDQVSRRDDSAAAGSPLSSPLTGRKLVNSSDIYNEIMTEALLVLQERTTLSENNPVLIKSVENVKTLHAALTNTSFSDCKLNLSELKSLRDGVVPNVSSCVEYLTSLLEFGFKSGDPSCNGGLLVSLISVILATLMNIFREQELSQRVSQKALVILVRQTASSLLDSRLASSSYVSNEQLDPTTSKQLVRATNKLAIQASIGSERSTSFQALMSLQLQLCTTTLLEKRKGTGDNGFFSRLSRIVTKLFDRVLKAEEGAVSPFSEDQVDLEALLCTLEDVLTSSKNVCNQENIANSASNMDESMEPCHNMAKTFMLSVLNARGGYRGAEAISDIIEDLGINAAGDSQAETLLRSCEAELRGETAHTPSATFSARKVVARATENSMDYAGGVEGRDNKSTVLAQLVSDVGKAEEGQERKEALVALRSFVTSNNDIDINSHLAHVSAPFRAYILEQLKTVPEKKSEQNRSGDSSDDETTNAADFTVLSTRTQEMSERIRLLRSKLNATEAAVQSVFDSGPETPTEQQRQSTKTTDNSPSPSQLVLPSSHRGEQKYGSTQRRLTSYFQNQP